MQSRDPQYKRVQIEKNLKIETNFNFIPDQAIFFATHSFFPHKIETDQHQSRTPLNPPKNKPMK